MRAPGSATFAGAVVVLTTAAATLALIGAAIWRYADGDADGGAALLTQGVGALATTTALLARTRPDPAATVEQPASITATPLEPTGGGGFGPFTDRDVT